MKLALGTAQFGLDYGINNTRGRIPDAEGQTILDEAFSAGISILDTSPAYGPSEAIIGSFVDRTGAVPRVVSKYIADGTDVAARARRTLGDLRMPSLYALLVHHYEDFQKNPAIWQQLRSLRDAGVVEKIGFSLYGPDHLRDMLARLPDVDIVQIPYSVCDRRFESCMKELEDRRIEIHARSVFLQGLLFRNEDAFTGHFSPAADPVRALRHIADEHRMSVAAAALGFVIGHDAVSAAVVGVDGIDNLRELIECARNERRAVPFMDEYDRCIVNDENILLPFRWKP